MKQEVTIFYTDDDQEDIAFFKEIVSLINSDLSVVTQCNGKELLHALDNPPPHPYVIYLDLNMPGLNGFDVLKKMRESHDSKSLPVVVFSTSSDEQTIQKSWDMGANYYLPKTGLFDQLKKSIEHTLNINWNSFNADRSNFVYNY